MAKQRAESAPRAITRRQTLGFLAGGTAAFVAGCGGAESVADDAHGGSAGRGGSGGGDTGGASGSGGSGGGAAGTGGAGGAAGSGGSSGADGGASCRFEPTPGCRITDDNILGPFYKENAPAKVDLAADVTRGTVVVVSGTVYGCDCATPLAGAIVDVWQADDDGAYDGVGFALRGKMTTDAAGRYEFRTILPGWYLNGDTFRPRHIHYKVSHADGVALTTQLYFEGDPHIPTDAFVRESLIRPLVEEPVEDGGTRLRVTFDIVLG
jgi:protocatechuate 3,4-dioxygenase beta subunit